MINAAAALKKCGGCGGGVPGGTPNCVQYDGHWNPEPAMPAAFADKLFAARIQNAAREATIDPALVRAVIFNKLLILLRQKNRFLSLPSGKEFFLSLVTQ